MPDFSQVLAELTPPDCSPYDVVCIARDLVWKITYMAAELIASDPKRKFIYRKPHPTPPAPKSVSGESPYSVVTRSSTASHFDEGSARSGGRLSGMTSILEGITETIDNTIAKIIPSEEGIAAAKEPPKPPALSCSSSNSSMARRQTATYSTSSHEEEKEDEQSVSASSGRLSLESQPPEFEWSLIKDFNFKTGIDQVREYVNIWQLSPYTRFAVVPSDEFEIVPKLGTRYLVDVLFSKPTYKCPNPLAVAVVRFSLYLSNIMPGTHSIMVTYQFEGTRSLHYALGDFCVRSVDFQRQIIDLIIKQKTLYFAAHTKLYDEITASKAAAKDVEMHRAKGQESDRDKKREKHDKGKEDKDQHDFTCKCKLKRLNQQ